MQGISRSRKNIVIDMQELESFIQDFNSYSLAGERDKVESMLQKDVVFFNQVGSNRLVGREACLETIDEYGKSAKTHSFEILKREINVWDSTAIIEMEYEVIYEYMNKNHHEKGKEIWTLIQTNDQWQMIYRHFVSSETVQ